MLINNYKKMIENQGEQTYLLLNNEDNLKLLNKQIYYNAKFKNDDVIGIKDDLNDLLEIIKYFLYKEGLDEIRR